MTTEIAVTDKMFGHGVIESYRRSDPSGFIAEARLSKNGLSPFDYSPSLKQATKERNARLIEMGLVSLADAEQRVLPLEFARTIYTELTGDELTMWRKFLPSRDPLHAFVYDSIPDEALGHIADAQTLGCFESIQIWSPQGNDLAGRQKRIIDAINNERAARREALARSLDPMAVGTIRDANGTERLFAIVRWGESLLPVEEIKAFIASVDAQEKKWVRDYGIQLAASAPLIIGIAVAVVFGEIWLANFDWRWTGFVVIPTAVIAVIAFIIAAGAWCMSVGEYDGIRNQLAKRTAAETA